MRAEAAGKRVLRRPPLHPVDGPTVTFLAVVTAVDPGRALSRIVASTRTARAQSAEMEPRALFEKPAIFDRAVGLGL